MWLHFVRAPAPAAPALLLLRRRLPPARPLGAAGGSAELPPPPATCGRGVAVQAGSRGPVRGRTEWGVASWPGAWDRSVAPLLLPGSEAAARASSRLARSFGGAYTCVTDRAESQLLPALPPTSATLSHWAAGLFRRNNKTCQSGEGQRVTETRLGGRGARRATELAGPGKGGGAGVGGREGTRVARGTRPASACPGSGPHMPAQRAGTRGARPRRASGIAFPDSENRPSGNLLSQKWVSSC